MKFHNYDNEKIIEHLKSSEKKNLILDTDTAAEIDDQFAVTYAMVLDDINVLAMTAAPRPLDESVPPIATMESNYKELIRVRDMVDPDGKMNIPCYRGSEKYMDSIFTPVRSEAAENIVRIVNEADDVVYICAIGCPTNVASALLLDPSIAEKAVVVLLGGSSFDCEFCGDFNFCQDVNAVRVILESGVPVILLPAMGGKCTDTIRLSNADIHFYLKDKTGKIGNYLCDIFDNEERPPEMNGECTSRQRSVYDIGAVEIVHDIDSFDCKIYPSYTVTPQCTWRKLENGKSIIYAEYAYGMRITSSFFTSLRKANLK